MPTHEIQHPATTSTRPVTINKAQHPANPAPEHAPKPELHVETNKDAPASKDTHSVQNGHVPTKEPAAPIHKPASTHQQATSTEKNQHTSKTKTGLPAIQNHPSLNQKTAEPPVYPSVDPLPDPAKSSHLASALHAIAQAKNAVSIAGTILNNPTVVQGPGSSSASSVPNSAGQGIVGPQPASPIQASAPSSPTQSSAPMPSGSTGIAGATPASPTQSANTVVPATPTQPSSTSAPTSPTQPAAGSASPTQSSGNTAPASSSQAANNATPSTPTQAASGATPASPTQAAPASPTQPAAGSAPASPTQSSSNAAPASNTAPSSPTQATNAAAPDSPSQPTQSAGSGQSASASPTQANPTQGGNVSAPASPTQVSGAGQPSSTSPADDFIVKGQINLFGNKALPVELEIWHGPAPDGVTVGSATPSIEQAVLKGDIPLSTIIPKLKGSAADNLVFSNVSILHQNYQYVSTSPVGWSLIADLIINESTGAIYKILSKILGVDKPTLHIQGAFGSNLSWSSAVDVNSLTLQGTFAGSTSAPTKGVVFTTIGITLDYSFGASSSGPKYEFDINGTMDLTVPGSVTPLELDYALTDNAGAVQLSATVPGTWSDVMGEQGLSLSNSSFTASLSIDSPWKSLQLNVTASFQYQSMQAQFTGTFIPGGSSQLNATIQNFDSTSISDLFQMLTHGKITLPKVDIKIDSATLSLASGQGLQVALQNLDVGGFTVPQANLSIASTGVSVTGQLTGGNLKLSAVTLTQAYLTVQYETASSGQQSEVSIGGEVTFEGLSFKPSVHLYPSSDDSKKLEWTIVGELTGSVKLSQLAHELAGGPFDLALQDVTFIAASQDDPNLASEIPVYNGINFQQGVQLLATLSIPQLNNLVGGKNASNVSGLILNASWSESAGFDLQVSVPSATTLHLGHGLTTTPITLTIETQPPSLMVSGGLLIPVAHSPQPLQFTLSLDVSPTVLDLAAELKGWWIDPLGISPDVKIGPDLAMQVNVVWEVFLATGTISGLAFAGGMMIGDVTAKVAFSIGDNPMQELLYGELDNLTLDDLVAFAQLIVRKNIPKPPSDFLDFKKLSLYVCPAPMQIGTTSYPQGFSFECDMIVFGKEADIKCSVTGGVISIAGSVQDFRLGPIAVSGTDSSHPDATIACTIGESQQQLQVDGTITMFAETVSVNAVVEILPSPSFVFDFSISFAHLYTFKVDASLLGMVSFKDISDAEFSISASLQTEILDYIRDSVIASFKAASEAAEEDIDAAEAKVTAAQKALDAQIDAAQQRLNQTQAAWNAKNQSVTAASNKTIADVNAEVARLKANVTSATAKYNAALNQAMQEVENANRDRAAKMAAANQQVTNARKQAQDSIQSAQGQLNQATADMDRDFGNAQKSIQDAQDKVNSLQNQINDMESKIRHLKWYEKPAAIGYGSAIAGLETARGGATAALATAKAVLTSSNYLGKQAAMKTAEATLQAAQLAAPGILTAAQASLHAVDISTQATVDAANQTLEGVKSGGDKAAMDSANAALQAYQQTADQTIQAANAAVQALMKSGEYVAYSAAQTGLSAAKGATTGLSVANNALQVAKTASTDALKIGQEVIAGGTKALDIQLIQLSGHIGKDTGSSGPSSFSALIKGIVLGKPFTLNADLNPSQVDDFLTNIFKSLWDDIKKDL